MLLEFSIKNYRSIKDEITFTLIAESSKSKPFNIFNQSLSNDDEVKLLKVAALFGSNASGKSNVIKALFSLLKLINDNTLSAGDKIPLYDPFKFDTSSRQEPCEFKLVFVGPSDNKYIYEVGFTETRISKEKLNYFPKGQPNMLFERVIDDSLKDLDKIILGNSLGKKEYDVFSNKLGISTFGNQIPHKVLTPIFTHLKKISLLNFASSLISRDHSHTTEILNENPDILQKVNELMRLSDTKIERISIKEKDRSKFNEIDEISPELADGLYKKNKYEIISWHKIYKNGHIVGEESIPLSDESEGTNSLYTIGGIIFYILNRGGVFFVDELDSSLHPHLSKLLVEIFQSPILNPKNAQLIFTSHETYLLDRTLLRKDQIWFTEKNDKGITDLISLQDFDAVREDTPFDKWYLAGKFGAIPNIKSLENILNNAQKEN